MDWIDPLGPGGLGVHESLLGNYDILFKLNLCFLLKHNIGDCLVYLDVYSLCSIVAILGLGDHLGLTKGRHQIKTQNTEFD